MTRGYTKFLISLLLLMANIGFSVMAEEDPRYASIKQLGQLNGVALKCRYFDQVSRIKRAIVATAPKERTYGLAFDISSNDSYLALIENRSPCPGPAGFSEQIDEGIAVMKKAFSTETDEK